MLLLCSLPLLGIFLVLCAIAAGLGLTGRIGDADLDWLRALMLYAAAWWTIFFGIDFASRLRGGVDLEMSLRVAAGESFFGLLLFLPTLVVLAAPVWFMLTGALATSIVVGMIAWTVSLFTPAFGPPI